MSYRDDIRDIRARLHRIQAELLPIHAGVDSAEAAALIETARATLRSADRVLGSSLAERLDADVAPHEAIVTDVAAQAARGRMVGQLFGQAIGQ